MALVVKNPPANAGGSRDAVLITGLGRPPGGGHGNPLQYSCLENSMNRGAWQATVHRVTKSQTRLKPLGMPHINTFRVSVFRLQKGVADGQSPVGQNVEGLLKVFACFRKGLCKVHTQLIINLIFSLLQTTRLCSLKVNFCFGCPHGSSDGELPNSLLARCCHGKAHDTQSSLASPTGFA